MHEWRWTPNEQFYSYIMARTVHIREEDNDARFVLDKHVKLNFYSTSSLKQQSATRHVASLGHIILIAYTQI